MKARSLHARLVTGAAIWAGVVLAAAVATAMTVVRFHPRQALLVHNGLLALGGAVLMTAGVSVIRRVLSPFDALHERLAAVRDGTTARLDGDYPAEVEPLVHDLNTLLEERDRRVERAVARAGDLAHGLKTPLAILVQEIDRAEAAGHGELAATMRQQVERMRRQIASHLAQARATAGARTSTARANVADAAHGLTRTMERLHADRMLVMTVDVPAADVVRVPAEDLEEMLGNLLDNACKWARSTITVSTARTGERLTICVDDDGPGLEAAAREQVLGRGVRADESSPGSGLGLAIVRDLADAYGGAIVLDHSPEGGLRAQLTLPLVK
jgi:signal transduction histidine kinase